MCRYFVVIEGTGATWRSLFPRYTSVEPSNRFNVVVAEIQRIVEKNRRNGDVYEKAAFDIYRDCDLVLAAFKTCERIVTTPIPYQYTHMVNLVLFFFVYSAPLIFTVTFKWITPFPSAILALGFFGGVASLLKYKKNSCRR